ncbi:nucleotidyltransferase domain-containing protein [Streptomyces sp. NPDC059875]|uniref:nucleotidyltransferase domain-containing protein n=1 Tax=unclassified Streptomyces TaxID=2593676 RepID=UPI0036683588
MVTGQGPEQSWQPAPLSEVAALFSKTAAPWWIAGGHAIELATGRSFREHHDIDVLVLRRDQLAVQEVLAGWQWWAADPPGNLRPWRPAELLPVGVHDVWCRPNASVPWRIQVMLDEAEGDDWVSRRDRHVRCGLADLGAVSAAGIPYLRPEVQLYYKAKQPRPKDAVDFAAVLPILDAGQRAWLVQSIGSTHGPHPWIEQLGE